MFQLGKIGHWAAALTVSIGLTATIWGAAIAQRGQDGSLGGDPMFAITQREFEQEGQLAYADRPAVVRAVMDRMYDNDGRYHTLSALFVDHTPGDTPGSVAIDIAQPSTIHTAAYANDTGSGTPIERTLGDDNATVLYATAANAYVVEPYAGAVRHLPSLASVPLSVVEPAPSKTTITGLVALQTVLANEFVHPAGLITSAFFTDKQVQLVGEPMLGSRPSWELQGRQVPGSQPLPHLGDEWRMWVDKQTGVVLRIENYAGTSLVGWAEMRDLAIDGTGQALGSLAAWSLPADAKRVDIEDYSALARSTH